jgi:hypothetical protein
LAIKIIDTTGVTQISTSDPDSRQIMTRNNISEVSYTVQTTVNALHDIPIDLRLPMKTILKPWVECFVVVKPLGHNNLYIYDKGYHWK